MLTTIMTAAVLTATGLGAAYAQARAGQDSSKNPSIGTQQTTAPAGADARELLGRDVKNAANATIGEIESVHLNPDGKVDGVIVGVGGFLGLGEREVLLEWRDLRIAENGEVVRTSMTRTQLKAMPEYAYKDKNLRGTVFTDKGVWTPDRTANRTATASVQTRSTGDFNVAGQMSAEALIGTTIKNATDESVGTIDDVYLDRSGNVKLVVVSVGGFAGMGAKTVGVPWGDLKLGRDGSSITIMTDWTKDSLKAMPDYEDERRMPTGTSRSGG